MRRPAKKAARPPRLVRPGELATVLDFVRYAATQFGKARLAFGQGTDDAAGDAVLLVCGTLNLAPQDFDAFAAARLGKDEKRRLFDLIETRVRTRKPVPYLINQVYMRGVPFFVDERTIIPRSYLGEILEGELFAGEEFSLVAPDMVERVLDLCTGSGCIAVLAAQRFPAAQIDAVDVSRDALAVAKINVAEHGLEDRISLLHGDLFKPVRNNRYDLILTNPPYVDASGMANLPAEYRHEPRRALDGGNDGIDIVRRIIDEAGAHLTPHGGVLCEIGRGRAVVEEAYPDRSFLWLDSAQSAGEVFWIGADQLQLNPVASIEMQGGRAGP
jgi:ribosomal protein L3 glutamine methyltransferase